MDKAKVTGLIGLIVLIPSISSLFSALSVCFAVISVLYSAQVTGEAVDPRLLAGELSAHITQQILSLLALLPGLFMVSVAVLKFTIQVRWFNRMLSLYAWILTCCLPLLLFIGLYLHWLKRKAAY